MVLEPSANAPGLVGPPREGDLYCPECTILIARGTLDAGPHQSVICPKHEPAHHESERLEPSDRLGVTQLPDLDQADVTEYFDEGGPSRPFLLVFTLIMKAKGNPESVDLPLESLVMPPLEGWDLVELATMVEGHGIGSRTRYPAPGWAEIRIMRTPVDGMVVHGPTLVSGFSAYVKFIEELNDWRIYRIGPQVDPAALP
jgi:hypothetical protein